MKDASQWALLDRDNSLDVPAMVILALNSLGMKWT